MNFKSSSSPSTSCWGDSHGRWAEWELASKVCISTSINFRSWRWEISYAWTAYYLGFVSASCLMFVLSSLATDAISVTVTIKPLRDAWVKFLEYSKDVCVSSSNLNTCIQKRSVWCFSGWFFFGGWDCFGFFYLQWSLFISWRGKDISHWQYSLYLFWEQIRIYNTFHFAASSRWMSVVILKSVIHHVCI